MLIVSLPEDAAARYLVDDTKFVDHLTDQLCSLYASTPKVMDPADVESVDAKWG